jgi:uncharacterized membrane protein
LIILGYAMQLAAKVAQPVSKLLPDAVVGVGGITVVAALLLIVVSFLAGLVARTDLGKRIARRFEVSFLNGLPQYQFVKSMAEGLAHVENSKGVQPALVDSGGGWQIGYLIEPLENGWAAVFLPQAPTPMSGNIMYLPMERVRLLDMPMAQAMALVKRMGVGSGQALRGVDLTIVAGD